MTKRSLKGTIISLLASWTRDFRISGWLNDTTPDSAKDNPAEVVVLTKSLVDDVAGRLLKGLIELAAPTTDFLAFDTTSAITNAGSVFTVNRTFYAFINNTFYKINTGSDTEVDTIILELSSTEDGPYQTLDITDGASGSGIVDVTDINWTFDKFSFDLANQLLKVKSITDEDDTGPITIPKGITQIFSDTITDEAGTGPPSFTFGNVIGTFFAELSKTNVISVDLTFTITFGPSTGNNSAKLIRVEFVYMATDFTRFGSGTSEFQISELNSVITTRNTDHIRNPFTTNALIPTIGHATVVSTVTFAAVTNLRITAKCTVIDSFDEIVSLT